MKNIKRTYLLLVIVIGLIFIATYSTYALFTSSLEIGDITLDTELKYTFKINSNQEFTIGSNSKLRFNAIVENDMEGTISYGVYYKIISPMEISDDVIIAEVTDTTTLTTSGPIEAGAENNITVPLVIINNSNEEVRVQIGVRTGYYTDVMTPDDIIYESGEVLITDVIDSETAGNGYQCEGSGGGNCTEECYDKYENGYKNTYCDILCINNIGSELQYNLDTSGANVPKLTENLIPAMHNGITWVTADTTNTDPNYQWYDYDAKKWANTVLLTESKRNVLKKYDNGNYIQGQVLGDSETDGVLAFYVWLPRYKYKVWNKDKVMGTDSYSAETKGIDIVFEKGSETTGTITCEYSFREPSENAGEPNEECEGNNGDYYTHPAFTFGTDELTGLWVSKFVLSSSSPDTNYGGGESISLSPRIIPNAIIWEKNLITNFWKVIYDMQVVGNIYGLNSERSNVDSHLLTNMEWGAINYLTNSKYGRCISGSCEEVAHNAYYLYNDFLDYNYKMTGCGPDSLEGKLETAVCNKYDSVIGLTASTTGNIYGIYDVSGVTQFTMGNMSSAAGSYIYNVRSGGENYTYIGYEKYVTTYAYGEGEDDQKVYNRGRLGDATSEIVLSSDKGWHGASVNFMTKLHIFDFNHGVWSIRGDSNYGGSFGISKSAGGNESTAGLTGSRAALAVFP